MVEAWDCHHSSEVGLEGVEGPFSEVGRVFLHWDVRFLGSLFVDVRELQGDEGIGYVAEGELVGRQWNQRRTYISVLLIKAIGVFL